MAGHEGEAYAVTFSPDGRQVISGGEDGTLRFWNAASGEPLRTLRAHQSCVNMVAYSPSGAIFATASCDRTIKLWDAATLNPLATLEGASNEVHALAFNPVEGHLLAAGGHESVVRLWDVRSSEVVRTIDVEGDANGLAWLPDGDTLLIACGTPSKDSSHGTWHMATDRMEWHPELARCVATSPRGEAAWGVLDSVNYRHDVSVWQPHLFGGRFGCVQAVAFSPAGDRLAFAGSDCVIRVWDTNRRVPALVHTGHTGRVQSLAFSPRGDALASASHDGTIRLWKDEPTDRQTLTCERVVSRRHDFWQDDSHTADISDDFRFLAIRSQSNEARVLRLADGSLVGTLPAFDQPVTLQFLPRSSVLLGVAGPAELAGGMGRRALGS